MKRPVWMIGTSLTLLLTAIVLARSGWFQARSATTRRHEHLQSSDPLASEAAWRWRHCQPAHWRACILQRQ